MARILVIDDEKGICDIIQMSLDISGHKALIAANGKEGLLLAEDNPIDLVVTDIFMPEQDGFETILQLKKISPHIKIIAISGGGYFNPDNALKMANHLGAHFGFNKPFDIGDLILKIEELLN